MASRAARKRNESPQSLGELLSQAHGKAEAEHGRLSWGHIAREMAERHRISVTDQTIGDYHNDQGGRRRNPLLVAALIDFYGLSLSDVPADDAERIVLARDLLKKVTPGTPPGTRTRNLQLVGVA